MLLFMTFTFANGQITLVPNEIKKIQFKLKDSLSGWQQHSKLSLNINQSAFENWQGGQTNQIELNARVTYNLTYQKDNLIWDNLLITDYGVNKVNGYEIRKTTDKIEFNSIVGGKLPHHWSYSFFLNLQTQLTNTYDYENDLSKENRIAGVFAPLYITAGPGVMWRKNNNLHFNIAPFSTKSVYMNGKVSKYDKDLNRFVRSDEVELYGIAPGEHFRHKFGFYASAFYKFKLMQNVFVDHRFSFYSNYLKNPENLDMDYALNIHMKINKFMSSKILIQTRYDDNERAGFQWKETMGIGVDFKI